MYEMKLLIGTLFLGTIITAEAFLRNTTCEFMPGDARGGRDVWLGYLTEEQCVLGCLQRKLDNDYSINGLTVHGDGKTKGCWCEKWMSHRNKDKRWKSCFLNSDKVDVSVRCNGMDIGCCTHETPCDIYDGDCDFDSHCKGDLICGINNCLWGGTDDCCMKPDMEARENARQRYDPYGIFERNDTATTIVSQNQNRLRGPKINKVSTNNGNNYQVQIPTNNFNNNFNNRYLNSNNRQLQRRNHNQNNQRSYRNQYQNRNVQVGLVNNNWNNNRFTNRGNNRFRHQTRNRFGNRNVNRFRTNNGSRARNQNNNRFGMTNRNPGINRVRSGSRNNNRAQSWNRNNNRTQSRNRNNDRTQSPNRNAKPVQIGNRNNNRVQRLNRNNNRAQSRNRNGNRVQSGNRNGNRVQSGNRNGNRVQSGNRNGNRVQNRNRNGSRVQNRNRNGIQVQRRNKNRNRVRSRNRNKIGKLARCKETVIPIMKKGRNNVVATLKTLPKEFRIRFSVRLSKEVFGLSSVLRFTSTDNNKEVFGDRIPAVFFLKTSDRGRSTFQVAYDLNMKSTIAQYYSFPTNSWVDVQIESALYRGKYWFLVIVDGNVIMNVQNHNPEEYEDVKIYVSDRFYQSFMGQVRNLKVKCATLPARTTVPPPTTTRRPTTMLTTIPPTTKYSLRCNGQDNGCCTERNPCDLGEGDCDADTHCKGDLVCGYNNCPWGDEDDCCMRKAFTTVSTTRSRYSRNRNKGNENRQRMTVDKNQMASNARTNNRVNHNAKNANRMVSKNRNNNQRVSNARTTKRMNKGRRPSSRTDLRKTTSRMIPFYGTTRRMTSFLTTKKMNRQGARNNNDKNKSKPVNRNQNRNTSIKNEGNARQNNHNQNMNSNNNVNKHNKNRNLKNKQNINNRFTNRNRDTLCSKVDLGFLLDSSGSIRSSYRKEKKFLKAVAKTFGVSQFGSRVGVVTFSHKAKLSIKLNDHDNIVSFNKAVDAIPIMGSYTRIDLALRVAERQMFTYQNGTREGTPKILILLTDGSQTKRPAFEKPHILTAELRQKGFVVIVVGIGRGVNTKELKKIAVTEENLFLAKSFKDLLKDSFIKRVQQKACKESTK